MASPVALAAWRELVAVPRLMAHQDLVDELTALDQQGDGPIFWRLCVVRVYWCINYMRRKVKSGDLPVKQQRLDHYSKLFESRELRILAAMGKLTTAHLQAHEEEACPTSPTPDTTDPTFNASLEIYVMHNGPWVTTLFMGEGDVKLPSPLAPKPSPEVVAAMASTGQLPPACDKTPLKHQEIILFAALSGSRQTTGTDPLRAGAAVAHNQSSYIMTTNENTTAGADWVPNHLQGNFASSRFYRSVEDHFLNMSMKTRIDHMCLDWFKATPVYFQQYIYGNGSSAGPPHLLLNTLRLFKDAGLKTAWLPVDQRGHLLQALIRVQPLMVDAQVALSFFPLHLISKLPDSNPLFAASVLVKAEVTANQQSGGGPLVQLAQYCHPFYPFVCLYAAKVNKHKNQHKAILADIWETQLKLPVMDEKTLAAAGAGKGEEEADDENASPRSRKRSRGCSR